jgi:hypothetical protein
VNGPAWTRERRVREALATLLPPRDLRAWGTEEVLVKPADYQWDVTADALRGKGFAVVEEPQGGYLRVT